MEKTEGMRVSENTFKDFMSRSKKQLSHFQKIDAFHVQQVIMQESITYVHMYVIGMSKR
jgi:hypothetical protein